MTEFRIAASALLTAIAASLATVPTQAAVVLDRSSFSANGGSYVFFGDTSAPGRILLQTYFTVVEAGRSGTLTSIALKLGKYTGSGLLELVLFDGGRQGSTTVGVFTGIVGPGSYSGALATAVFDIDSLTGGIDDVTNLDVSSAGLVLDPGHVFSFMLRSIEPVPALKVGFARTTTDDPTFATTYFSGNSGIPYFNDRIAQQIQFQSFVEDGVAPTVAGVPEPASWAFMVAGFGLVGGAARRRRPVRAVSC